MIRVKGTLADDGIIHEVEFVRHGMLWKAYSVSGGLSDGFHLNRLNELLNEDLPIAGTYYPKKGGLLAAYNVLRTRYFYELVGIVTTYPSSAFEQMPSEEGVVY